MYDKLGNPGELCNVTHNEPNRTALGLMGGYTKCRKMDGTEGESLMNGMCATEYLPKDTRGGVATDNCYPPSYPEECPAYCYQKDGKITDECIEKCKVDFFHPYDRGNSSCQTKHGLVFAGRKTTDLLKEKFHFSNYTTEFPVRRMIFLVLLAILIALIPCYVFKCK